LDAPRIGGHRQVTVTWLPTILIFKIVGADFLPVSGGDGGGVFLKIECIKIRKVPQIAKWIFSSKTG
jgi:hypothetical protein